MTGKIIGPEPGLFAESQASLKEIDAVIETTGDPWHRTMLVNWRDHYWAEVMGDLDAIMATLAPSPIYRTYGWLVSSTDTTEEARAAYGGLIEAGYRPAGPVKNVKFAFADWGLVAQFTLTAIYPGIVLNGPDIDPQSAYRIRTHILESHPYDKRDGLMGGETVFLSAPLEVVRVER